MAEQGPVFGQGDATFRAAGGEPGIRRLVDCFYEIMQRDYPRIFSWHPPDIERSRDKLACFLCGWMGGPRRYAEKYGSIRIPGVHAHLPVDDAARDDWLQCMAAALAQLDYPVDFVDYLLTQLAMPANMIRRVALQQNS